MQLLGTAVSICVLKLLHVLLRVAFSRPGRAAETQLAVESPSFLVTRNLYLSDPGGGFILALLFNLYDLRENPLGDTDLVL